MRNLLIYMYIYFTYRGIAGSPLKWTPRFHQMRFFRVLRPGIDRALKNTSKKEFHVFRSIRNPEIEAK